MTKKELIELYRARLQFLVQSGDTESAHAEADNLLCELLTKLGCEAVVETYKRIERWYA